MAQHSRSELYKIYKGGFHDKAFEHLVDSSLNIKDDRIEMSTDFGLAITPRGTSRRLMSFFEKISDRDSPLWSISFDDNRNSKGINFAEGGQSRLFLQNGGMVGVNNDQPSYQLDVNGLVASKGWVGSFGKGTCSADGDWHTITALRNLDGCQAFEIFAHINDDDDRRFALTNATLLISHGKRGHTLKTKTIETGSSWLWGKFLNKLKIRWIIDDVHTTQDKQKYMVQIKSRTHYGMKNGKPKPIFYRVSKLWDKDYELEKYNKAWEDYSENVVEQVDVPVVSQRNLGNVKKELNPPIKVPSFKKNNMTITKKKDT